MGIESQLTSSDLVMADPNYTEVGHVSLDCQQWLGAHLSRLPVTNAVIREALQITAALGVINSQYHPLGVDENDIFCIATAKVQGCSIISDEALQPSLPSNIQKYKIPAVCNLPVAAVHCETLNTYIRNSNTTF